MSNQRFENLLKQMPKIAKVINSFESPEVQREVFTTLIRALEQEELPQRQVQPQPQSKSKPLDLDNVKSVSLHDDITEGLDLAPEIGGGSIHSFIDS